MQPQSRRGLMEDARSGCRWRRCVIMPPKLSKKEIESVIQSLCVLVVDDNQYMRKMVRTLLVNCGVKDIYEAGDGIAALDTLRTVAPDVVILDWEMPLLNGRRTGAHRALARRVSDARRADHHAQRLMANAGVCVEAAQARRQRISDQAGFGEGDLRPARLHHAACRARSCSSATITGREPRKLITEGLETPRRRRRRIRQLSGAVPPAAVSLPIFVIML